MNAIALAFRVFFRTLSDKEVRQRMEDLLSARPPATVEVKPAAAPPKPPEPKPKPKRSEAISLLAALQREARLVDFLQEPVDAYSDAQIGAAVRDIHRGCKAVLERCFALQPVLTEAEGASIEIPAGFDAARYTLIGNVSGHPPYRGALCHPGWQATRCELPEWTGNEQAARIVAPAEVELK